MPFLKRYKFDLSEEIEYFLIRTCEHSRCWSIKWYGGGADYQIVIYQPKPKKRSLFSFFVIQVPDFKETRVQQEYLRTVGMNVISCS